MGYRFIQLSVLILICEYRQIKTDLTLKKTLYHSYSVQDSIELDDQIGAEFIATGGDSYSVNLWDTNNLFNLTANLTSHIGILNLFTLSKAYCCCYYFLFRLCIRSGLFGQWSAC